jgi:hypothetical protein
MSEMRFKITRPPVRRAIFHVGFLGWNTILGL